MRRLLLTAAAAGTLGGQSAPATHDPRFTWGLVGGAAGLRSDASQQAASALFEYKPVTWLTLSANPSADRVTVPSTTGGGSVSSIGPTDLPLGIAASHEIPHAPLSPTLGAGLELSLSTGNSSTGLGSGQTGLAGELGGRRSISRRATTGRIDSRRASATRRTSGRLTLAPYCRSRSRPDSSWRSPSRSP